MVKDKDAPLSVVEEMYIAKRKDENEPAENLKVVQGGILDSSKPLHNVLMYIF